MSRVQRALWVLLPVLTALLIYGSTLQNGWFLDDWKLFTDTVWTPGRYTSRALGPLDAWTSMHGLYIDDPSPAAARFTRPITDMYYLLLRGREGYSPAVVHAGNLAVHALICGGLGWLGGRGGNAPRAESLRFAAAGGLFLSAHSATAYVVPWCADACDVLALAAVIPALVAAEGQGRGAVGAYGMLLVTALFTKESTAPVLVLAPTLALLAGRRRHAAALAGVGLVAAGLYGGWYLWKIPAIPAAHAGTALKVALCWLPVLTSWPAALAKSGFVGQLHPSDAGLALGGAAVLLGLGIASLRASGETARACTAAGVTWVALTVPAAAGGLMGFLCARYVYVPLGASLAVLVVRLAPAGSPRVLNIATALLVALSLANLPRTVPVVLAYQDEGKLWAEDARYGGDALALTQLARVRFAQHRDADGLDAWMSGMAALPGHDAYFEPSPQELAEVAQRALALHRPDDAMALMDYRRASTRPMPENGPTWCAIAEASRQLGRDATDAEARCKRP